MQPPEAGGLPQQVCVSSAAPSRRAAGPWFARFAIDEDPQECVRRVQFPCVLKPLALSASRGVIRADDAQAFVAAFERVAALLKRPEIQAYKDDTTDWLLAEGYLPGKELALEGLLDAGRLRVLALFDKPDPLDGPFFEETIYVTPSREAAATQQEIIAAVEQAARALGLQHGPVHAELRSRLPAQAGRTGRGF
jgi:biotin carboxylase